MNITEFESPLTKTIAILLYYFSSDSRTKKIPEGAIQKALSILIKGLKLEIPDVNIRTSKQGYMIGGLSKIPSKYYRVEEIKSKDKGKHLRYVFCPNLEIIQKDFTSNRFFRNSPVPRFARHLSKIFNAKGKTQNLNFISFLLENDNGYYFLGYTLYRLTEIIGKLLHTQIDINTCNIEINDFLMGLNQKINSLKNKSKYYNTIRECLSGELDKDTQLFLSLINIDPNDKESLLLLSVSDWLKEEIKEIHEIVNSVIKQIPLNLQNRPRGEFLKESNIDKNIHQLIIKKNSKINSILYGRNIARTRPLDIIDKLCAKYKDWAFALMSGASPPETYFRGTHWNKHSSEKCKGEFVVAWADAIGSSKIEEFLRDYYPEDFNEMHSFWHNKFHTIIRNWGIVFDAFVPPEGVTINGDQMVLLYNSLVQAILGSSFAIFFARLVNKVTKYDKLKIGYKILISNSRVEPSSVLDTDFQKKIKIVKPKNIKLLEHTKQNEPKEGYIIISKEFCESNFHLIKEYRKFLYKTEIINTETSKLKEIYSVKVIDLINFFVNKIQKISPQISKYQ